MDHEIQVFCNDRIGEVRIVMIDGEPWWVLKDICKILELSTPVRVAERLEEDEVSQTHLIDRLGRKQVTTIISESGLYNVILRSDKPQAKPFRKWVTSEILPAIRKTGRYGLDDAAFLINKFFPVATEQQRMFLHTALTQIEILNTQIEENRPKVEFAEQVAGTDTLITIGTMAKISTANGIQMGQNRLFQFLRDMHILIDSEDKRRRNLPYQEYLDRGYFKVREKSFHKRNGTYEVYFQTMVTGKGQLYIIKRLRKDYYPEMYPPEFW